jgi:1L-myo-inositol 1-phosphate cytidylyltransferase / CDP-L-myo-inositol myo-inositolphosphotransferase
MKGLILAAGLGNRLNALSLKVMPKPLYRILGRTLIEWVILNMKSAGINEIYVVVGFKADEVMEKIGDGSEHGVKINYIGNPNYKKELALSLLCAKDYLKSEDEFLLSMSDHLFDPMIFSKFVKAEKEPGSVMLCVDKKFDQHSDIADAAKIKVNENNILVKNSKDLTDYDYMDCGLFRCSPIIFDAIEEGIKNDKYDICSATELLGKQGKMFVWDIEGLKWSDVDTGKDLFHAEKKMADTLR